MPKMRNVIDEGETKEVEALSYRKAVKSPQFKE